ncbi:OmpH family outer membrane protein [Thermodesulfobacteriota bacterium]
MQRNLLLSITICIALVLGLSIASHAVEKVGYINLQRLVNESEMGKAAKNDIQKLRGDREALLRKKLKEVNDLKEFISKEGSQMDPAEKRNNIQKLNRTYKEYQRLVADAREDIANEDRDLVAIILKKADGVLKKVAKKKKYAIILKDPNAIGYLDADVDITDDVLKALNR